MNNDNTKAAAIKVAGSIMGRRRSDLKDIGWAAALIVHNLNKELARLDEKK